MVSCVVSCEKMADDSEKRLEVLEGCTIEMVFDYNTRSAQNPGKEVVVVEEDIQ